MNRKSLKKKNIFKSVAFGAALVLCGSFVPVGAIQTLAADWNQSSNPSKTDGQIAQNTNRIEVDASGIETTVAKGGKFTIPTGNYYGGSTTAHIIGTASEEGITSKVVARYADGAVVYDSSEQEGGFQSGVQFDADRVGQYEIVYSVTDDGVTYTYTLDLRCTINDVSFVFDTNDQNIVPSVYDLSLSEDNGTFKDIVLPVPTITDEKGNEIVDVPVHIDGEDATEEEYMTITLDQGYSDDVKVARTSDGKYYIDGDSLSEANGSTFNIVYTFYQNGAQIASTTKSFTVDDSYYTDSNKNPGYTLTISRATSAPSSAVVGVKTSLPSINATTSASDTPSSESVTVSYVINVYRMENGNVVETIQGAIDEDYNFTAPKNGDYRIEYVATDFYGHTATNSFTITNVRDTQSATPYIYDAGAENPKNEDGSYKSALNYVKSKTENRNIVIFAIGGHDNAVAEDELNLYREIRSGTNSNVILYDIQGYDHYNLIFNAQTNSQDKSVYRAIYDDNAYIRNQMILGGDVATDDDTIKNWLKEHKYLIVTDGQTDPITGEAFAFAEGEAPTTEDEWSALGYACIEPSSNQTFAVQIYNVYYYANDNVETNNAGLTDYSFEIVANADDSAVPTILYSTELKDSYLENEVITLAAPTASDEGGDSYVDLHTAYRYLDSSRQPITTVGEEIEFVINDASKRNIPSDRWYIQADGNNVVSSSGWTVLEGEDEYEIDLSNKPEGAAYIEFFSYAIDDQGNVAFYSQQSQVSNIEDSIAPYLYDVVSAPEVDGGYINNQTIVLPTLTYKDNLPQYMTSAVVVYRVDRDTQEQIVVHSSGMNGMPNRGTGDYVLMAGQFTPSVGGTYIAAVTVSDAGNHSVTTYFAYEVDEIPVVEDIEITNIGQDSTEIVVGETETFAKPKISVSVSDEIGFVGFDAYSSENIAIDYYVTMEEADNNEYQLNQGKGEFTAYARGTYTLKYTAFLISYSTNEDYFSTAEGGEEGKLFLTKDDQGQYVLAYKADGTENLVGSGQATAGETYLITRTTKEGENTLSAKCGDKELDISQLPQYSNSESVVNLHVVESKPFTVVSGEVAVNLYMDDSAYPKTQYGDLSSEVLIKELDGDVSGNGRTDLENSNVSISFTEAGGTTRIIDTISLADWTVSDSNAYLRQDGKNIYLKLNRNGQYTITYTLKAVDYMGMSVGSTKTKTYTLSVGDVIAPELTIDNTNNQFIAARYNVGDTVDIRIADESLVTVSDPGGSSRDELLKNLTITVRNTSTNSSAVTLSNQSDVEGQYAYSYTIEEEGTYQISISVRDAAGNTSQTSTFTFTVGGDSTDPVNVTEVVGKVLIGVAAVILAGVVVYFIVSKVKENKGKKTK